MALDAGIAGVDVVHPRGIHDVLARGMRRVLAAGTVATLAADIPLDNLFAMNVVVDRMASVTEWSGRTGVVLRAVVWHPPVGVVGDVIFAPLLVLHFPLCAERKNSRRRSWSTGCRRPAQPDRL